MVFQNSSRVSENKKPVVMIIINACDKRPSLDWWSWLGLTIWLSLLIDNWLDEGGLKGSIRWIYKINVFLRTQNSFYTSKRWASRSYSHLQNSVPVRTFYIKVYKFICSMFATSPAPTPPVIREGFLHKSVCSILSVKKCTSLCKDICRPDFYRILDFPWFLGSKLPAEVISGYRKTKFHKNK